jgi:hypothetical protein
VRLGRPDEVSGLKLAWSARGGALRSEQGRVRRAEWDKHMGRLGRKQASYLTIIHRYIPILFCKRMINIYDILFIFSKII